VTDRFLEAVRRPLVVLDAAMGTRLIAAGLRLESDDPALWNHSHPEAVAALHRTDRAAGAEALLTNTFGANRVWLDRYDRGGQAAEINRRAAALARAEAGPDGLVLGSVGPTAAGDPGAWLEQAAVLAAAGTDALVLETFGLDQAEAALRQVRPAVDVPIVVSLAAWPDPVAPAVRRLAGLGIAALGGNCQAGVAPALWLARQLRSSTALPLWIKPSAGLPGGPLEPAEAFGRAVPALRALGPVLFGGCCGTTEAHVAAIRAGCYDSVSGRTPNRADAPPEGPP
jgi:methionine synthase I (cobalamin-dependent)